MEEQAEYKTLKPSPGPNDLVYGGSGLAYKWHVSLSTVRYKKMRLLGVEFLHDMSFADVTQAHNRMWALLNKHETAGASVELYKLREHMVNLKEGRNPGVEVCALFLLAPGEDPGEFDEQQHAAKVEDLEKGGYDVSFFFNAALDLLPGLRDSFAQLLQELSKLNHLTSPTDPSAGA